MLALIPYVGPFARLLLSLTAIFKFWQSKMNPTLLALLPLQLSVLF